MPYVLALDQGTTSSRAILFDEQGNVCGLAQREFEQIFPQPGWVEHDANEIWSTQLAVAQEVLASAGVDAGDLDAIGITNQRETTVLWDREGGEPVGNAIVWQDRRTAGICDALREAGHEPTFREKTGLVLDAYFSGTKIQWILDNVPGAREKADAGRLAFGTIDSWLVWKLSGGRLHITDASNASRTLLYDIRAQRWDEELCRLLDVPQSVLPEVRASSEVYCESEPSLLGAPVRIAGIAGDQQAALFGQMCTRKGMVKTTYGTGCFMLINTGEEAIESENNLLTTIAWRIGDRTEYALEGSIFVGGAVIQWLRDGLGLFDAAPESEALAASVPDTGGVYLVPAFTGLGAPHWDPYARGTIVGLTRGTTGAHLTRAALEGIAFQVADVLEAMEADAGISCGELRVDGGAAMNDLLMQFQADLVGVPIARPSVLETTALGAAYLAGLAVGTWQSVEQIAELWQLERPFERTLPADEVAERRRGWARALERSFGWEESGRDEG